MSNFNNNVNNKITHASNQNFLLFKSAFLCKAE